MKRKNKVDLPPLDPEIKASGRRVLERAFGEFGVKGGTPSDLRTILDREIIEEKPNLKDDPSAVLNVSRLLMARFFEIVADEPETPRGKKHDQIIENFFAQSTAKYKAKHPDAD